MKNFIRILTLVLALTVFIGCVALPAFADEGAEPADEAVETVKAEEPATDNTAVKAIVAGAVIAIGAGIGAFGMTKVVSKSAESTARQPEAGGDIRSSMMLGLVFIETAIIYALIVAILVIFVM